MKLDFEFKRTYNIEKGDSVLVQSFAPTDAPPPPPQVREVLEVKDGAYEHLTKLVFEDSECEFLTLGHLFVVKS